MVSIKHGITNITKPELQSCNIWYHMKIWVCSGWWWLHHYDPCVLWVVTKVLLRYSACCYAVTREFWGANTACLFMQNMTRSYMGLLGYYSWLPGCCYGIQNVAMQLLGSSKSLTTHACSCKTRQGVMVVAMVCLCGCQGTMCGCQGDAMVFSRLKCGC